MVLEMVYRQKIEKYQTFLVIRNTLLFLKVWKLEINHYVVRKQSADKRF